MTEEYKKLEEMRKDPAMRFIAKTLRLNLDELIDEAIKETEEKDKSSELDTDSLHSETPPCANVLKDDQEKSFLLSEDELEEFVKKYLELENVFKKLDYAYGIDMNSKPNSIYVKYNELIWTLIRKIFGSNNADEIADYIFDNSKYDSIQALYEELA